MLQPGERIDNHDKICAQYYAGLLAMGMYDEEFALFGVAYIREGRSKCFVSPSRDKVYAFVNECREKQIYPTAVESFVRRVRVHSGEREKVENQYKLEFARELGKHYPHDFLLSLQKIAQCPINNQAEKILTPLRENLSGCFDEGALQLFSGAVEYAYDGKILTAAEYQKNKLWLERELDFLTEKLKPASNFRRNMTGFAYFNQGKLKHYATALEERTQERRLELLCEGKIVSPIYRADYCFNNYAELPRGIKWFDDYLAKRMDENYGELILDLYALKPEIEARELDNLAEKYAANKYILRTINYYRSIWHLHE